nr:uncharacterized protein LOC103448597 isoform X3 [Malus domestica]
MHRENHSPLCPPSTTSANRYSTTTQVKTKKKKNKITNFFPCFRSSDVTVLELGRLPKNVFTYMAIDDKERGVFPKVVPMSLSSSLATSNDEGDDEKCHCTQQEEKGRCGFSQVLKAVLVKTKLAKKIQKRKKGKKLGRNESSKYNSKEDDPKVMSDTASFLTNCSIFTSSSINSSSSSISQTSNSSIRYLSKRIKSFRSSSSCNFKANLRYLSVKFRSTSTSTSSKANSRSNSDKHKLFEANKNASKEGQGQQDQDVTRIEKNKYKKVCYRSIVSLCFLLMVLWGLMFYGKICAILCTLVWLFSVPLWCTSVGHHGLTNKIDKKKFIIGGLLPRDTQTIH